MKKLLAIMMALVMVVTLSQCKKQNEENEVETAKVRISCTIPINKNSRTHIESDGTVNWSKETERIYLAIPSRKTVVELASTSEEGGATLTFTGNVESSFLEDGLVYDVWYLGRGESKLNNGTLKGSIATQSGDLEDLGYHHIAKATVTAIVGDGIITLKFNNDFENQIAIVRLGDESSNTSILRGNAIIGTDYSLQYDGEKFELAVTKSTDARISVAPQTEGESYVVVFPNTNNNVELISDSGKKVTFLNGVKAGSMYNTVGWEEYEGNNGYEYVDLGLPSGLKWAKYNVGANTAEAYGDYFAWGEIETKDTYTMGNCSTDGVEMSGISGKSQYDAATANWESTWRMPTQWEMQELIDNCTWTWTQLNGVNGYNVTGTNGKSIFLPAAGLYSTNTGVNINEHGSYWTSTPTTTEENQKAYNLVFNSTNKGIGSNYRENGRPIRPVCGGAYAQAEVTTAEVTNIKDNSAVCGGNVEDNGCIVTERGVCWSTSENPTIDDPNDNKIADENAGEGEYTVTLTGLTSATFYYVRAYAINEAGISYGSQVIFNTTETGNNGYVYNFNNMRSHAVDLGLPSGVLWSDCNIGAEWAVEQAVWPVNIYGNYFMWACNTSSQYFGEGSYPDYAKAVTINNEIDYSYNYSGDIRYDAATNLWGGNWRTPTDDDIDELINNCTPERVKIKGIQNGQEIEIVCMKFTGPNGKSIYFPLGGVYYDSSELDHRNDLGFYLTASIYNRKACRDWILKNVSDYHRSWDLRWYGYSLRPVIGPKAQ